MISPANEYKTLFKIANILTIIMLVIIPLQILVFSFAKIPVNVIEWYSLFNTNILFGFFHSDFFILLNNIIIVVIYLALYQLLKKTNKGLLQIGIVLGLIGLASYVSSNKTFEILALSKRYFATTIIEEQKMLEIAGISLLREWQGTAFNTYYVLNGIALFIIALGMYKSSVFTKATATWGLASAILMCIPSTAGIIGIVFSLLSLIPWYVFSIKLNAVFKIYSSNLTTPST